MTGTSPTGPGILSPNPNFIKEGSETLSFLGQRKIGIIDERMVCVYKNGSIDQCSQMWARISLAKNRIDNWLVPWEFKV